MDPSIYFRFDFFIFDWSFILLRLNFSHGDYEDHGRLIDNIRKAESYLDRPVAIMQDLQGPKIRIGQISEKGIDITEKKEVILKSEAAMTDQVNRAKGEAEAILTVAEATAKGIELVATSIEKTGGEKAVALRLAEQYIQAFSNLAKETNTILLPENTGDTGAMVAQALSVFNSIQKQVAADK
jgi:hypothetical protein